MIECVPDASIFQRKEGFIKLKTALYYNNQRTYILKQELRYYIL